MKRLQTLLLFAALGILSSGFSLWFWMRIAPWIQAHHPHILDRNYCLGGRCCGLQECQGSETVPLWTFYFLLPLLAHVLVGWRISRTRQGVPQALSWLLLITFTFYPLAFLPVFSLTSYISLHT